MTDTELILAAAELDTGLKFRVAKNDFMPDYFRCDEDRDKDCHELPPYLTSTDAALRLVEKLKLDDWWFTASNTSKGYCASVYREGTTTKAIHDPSLPRAITLVCLRAAGKLK